MDIQEQLKTLKSATPKDDGAQIVLRVPSDMARRLDRAVGSHGISRSSLVRLAIDRTLREIELIGEAS